MATNQDRLTTIARRRRGGSRYFFVTLSLFALVMALVVNVPTYHAFFAGRFPIAAVVNVHATLMGLWLATFVTQGVLASSGRIALHRKLGAFGIVLGLLVWMSMVFVEVRAMVVKPPGKDSDLDWLLPGVYCYANFPVFFGAAVWLRHVPAWHKRLMVFATFVALQAVEQRMGWLPHSSGSYWTDFAYVDACLILPLAGFDWVSSKRLHPATLLGGVFLLAAQLVVVLAWGTPGWHRLAADVVRFLRGVF